MFLFRWEGWGRLVKPTPPDWTSDIKLDSLLQFSSLLMSRLHFRIYSIGAGIDVDTQAAENVPLVYCEDRLSFNGTYVNGTLIGNIKSPRNPYLLENGDVITIRPHWQFRFRQHVPPQVERFTESQKAEMRVRKNMRRHTNNTDLFPGL